MGPSFWKGQPSILDDLLEVFDPRFDLSLLLEWENENREKSPTVFGNDRANVRNGMTMIHNILMTNVLNIKVASSSRGGSPPTNFELATFFAQIACQHFKKATNTKCEMFRAKKEGTYLSNPVFMANFRSCFPPCFSPVQMASS